MEFVHKSVLLNEAVDMLNVRQGGVYADLTMGGGGHTAEILRRGGIVYGFDRDGDAIDACVRKFKNEAGKFFPIHSSFEFVSERLAELNAPPLDGVLADLGVSSYQLDEAERGFSYMHDAPLDMRMDRSESLSAKDIVNGCSKDKLVQVISDYGEEKWAVRIADFIVKRRAERPIETTFELVDTIKAAIPAGAREDGPHPAKRTFQAIRIEVNGELRILEKALRDSTDCLKKGGRIAVITFHSLEDRIVKDTFKSMAHACVCPKSFPVCVCGRRDTVKIITKKPILPSETELTENPRSRSAKLRAAEKII